MKAKIITLSDDKNSFELADKCIDSSNHYKNNFVIDKYLATDTDNVIDQFKEHNLKWNYPWTKGHLDIQSGLYKTPYETAEPSKRMACFMSHYRLWKQCAEEQEEYMILEHDAIFTRRLDLKELIDKHNIISLNDPRGATRKSAVYHNMLHQGRWSHAVTVMYAPWIDENRQIPQGLPGNSAYYITPIGARTLIELVRHFGAWPNDAIMCKQLMPRMLGCLTDYATTIQPSISTTTK